MIDRIPAGSEVAELRERIGLTQSQMAEIMGLSLSTWQRKESDNAKKLVETKIAEFNFLLLLAGLHPEYQLGNRDLENVLKRKSTAPEVTALREKLGLSREAMAKLFGYSLSGWSSKENPNRDGSLNVGEFNFLQLLAGMHASMDLIAL